MSKIAVVYWSGTGNTEAMAAAVVEGAKNKGAVVSLVPAAEFSAANHHHIIEVFHLRHGLQLSHQVQAGLQSLGARLPLCRAHLIPVLRHELAGLDLPQQLVGVAAHVAGVDLVGHDFSFGIHDETAPLRHAVGLDVDLEITC